MASVLAYTLWHYGGVHAEWHWSVLAVGLLSVLYWTAARPERSNSSLDPALKWLLVSILGFVLLQCIPLPQSLVAAVSAPRSELSTFLEEVGVFSTLTTLTLVPAETASHLIRLTAYVAVFLLVRSLATQLGRQYWLVILPIIVLGGLEAVLGLLQSGLGQTDTVARGTYVSRTHFAGLLEMAFPFAVMYSVAVMRRSRPHGSLSLGHGIIAGALLVVAATLLLGIIYSLSRMGFAAALCSLFVMPAVAVTTRMRAKGRSLVYAVVGSLVVFSFLFLPPDQLIHRFADLSSAEKVGSQGRLHLWTGTLPLIADYPLFGCGLGAYESAFLRYKFAEPLYSDPYAHNDYLQGLAETGVIGFTIFSTFIGLVLWRAVRFVRQVTVSEARCLALACLGSLSAILIHSLVDFNLYIPANAMVFWWVLGITSVLPVLAEQGAVWLPTMPPQVVEIQAATGESPARQRGVART